MTNTAGFRPTETTVPYRLRLPGPTDVPARVLRAAARPIIAHRSPEFLARFRSIQDRLMPILGTSNRPYIFPSSGIGAMESGVVNTIGAGDRALVLTNGQWGPVFKRMIEAIGGIVDEVTTPWGAEVDLARIEKALKEKDYAAVFAVHSESSTGVLTDLEAVGKLVRQTPALLVTDSVSGLGGATMWQEAWGIDVVVSASQKALMSPPGLAIASLTEKAWNVVKGDGKGPRSYFDFRKFRPLAEKGEPTYTAPVSSLNALDEALTMIHEEGIEVAIARHRRCNDALRAGLAALGFRNFPQGVPSPTLVVMRTPPGIDAPTFIKHLQQVYNTDIATTRNEEIKPELVRIGTMGTISDGDVLTDLHLMALTLRDMGAAPDLGAAIAAASGVLSS